MARPRRSGGRSSKVTTQSPVGGDSLGRFAGDRSWSRQRQDRARCMSFFDIVAKGEARPLAIGGQEHSANVGDPNPPGEGDRSYDFSAAERVRSPRKRLAPGPGFAACMNSGCGWGSVLDRAIKTASMPVRLLRAGSGLDLLSRARGAPSRSAPFAPKNRAHHGEAHIQDYSHQAVAL